MSFTYILMFLPFILALIALLFNHPYDLITGIFIIRFKGWFDRLRVDAVVILIQILHIFRLCFLIKNTLGNAFYLLNLKIIIAFLTYNQLMRLRIIFLLLLFLSIEY